MRKSRFTEEQIIAVLAEQERVRQLVRFVAAMASAQLPFTNGKPNMVAFMYQTRANSKCLRARAHGSRNCWLTACLITRS